MDNPILVEAVRGALLESQHRGAVSVVDAEGVSVLSIGDVECPTYPRSAVKVLQALPLVESGIAERFGLTDAELALACASHSGELEHVRTAASMLAKVGQDASCLECGVQWPLSEAAGRALVANGERPTTLHNTCSGKHAGFVCLACGLGEPVEGYTHPEHHVQRVVRSALEDVTGAAHSDDVRGIDGCSVPTYAVPLPALAYGFAKFGTGTGMSRACAAAARRIRTAVSAYPIMLAGAGRFDTRVTVALGRRAFVKTGAEGVHCAALPELGYGIAVKCDDGARRAAEVIMATLISRYLVLDDAAATAMKALAQPSITSRRGETVGEIRATRILHG